MAALYRKAPGSRAAITLVVAGFLSRWGVFPSIDMVRAQHERGGDTITWGLELTTIADHLRYENSWASHRLGTAFFVDALHPALLLAAGSLVAAGMVGAARRLPRGARVSAERSVRRATVFAYAFFALVVALRTLLSRGAVQGPREVLLSIVGVALVAALVLAVRGRRAPWPRLALRSVATVGLSVPLVAALLALSSLLDGRHMTHVPFAWALGVGLFLWGTRTAAGAQRRLLRSALR